MTGQSEVKSTGNVDRANLHQSTGTPTGTIYLTTYLTTYLPTHPANQSTGIPTGTMYPMKVSTISYHLTIRGYL